MYNVSSNVALRPQRPLIVQELSESRGGRPGLSVLTSLLVSVDIIIEPCLGIGHSLSLICQLTSEDIKHHFIVSGEPRTSTSTFCLFVYLFCRDQKASHERSMINNLFLKR